MCGSRLSWCRRSSPAGVLAATLVAGVMAQGAVDESKSIQAALDREALDHRELARIVDAGEDAVPGLLAALGSFDDQTPAVVRRRLRALRCLRLVGPEIADAVVPTLIAGVAMDISRDDAELLHTLGQLAPGLTDPQAVLRELQRAKPKAPATQPLPRFIRWVDKMRLWYDLQHRLVWKPNDDVSAWIKDLGDEDPLRRRFAAEQLGRIGPSARAARNALIETANTERHPRITRRKGTGSLTANFHQMVRDAAAIAIARIDATHPSAARGLTLLLQADSTNERLGALMSIVPRPDVFDVVPAVVQATQNDDARVAAEAVSTLGRLGDTREQVLACLRRVQGSKDRQLAVRAQSALRALGRSPR